MTWLMLVQDEVTDGGNTGAESDQQIDVCLDTSLDEILNTVDVSRMALFLCTFKSGSCSPRCN